MAERASGVWEKVKADAPRDNWNDYSALERMRLVAGVISSSIIMMDWVDSTVVYLGVEVCSFQKNISGQSINMYLTEILPSCLPIFGRPAYMNFVNLVSSINSTSKADESRYMQRDAHQGKEIQSSIHSVHRWLLSRKHWQCIFLALMPTATDNVETSPKLVFHFSCHGLLTHPKNIRMT